MYHKEYIYEQFKKINIELNEKQINQFYHYFEMIVEKNKVVNLTAITEYEDVVIKHFVDSVLVSQIDGIRNLLEVNENSEVQLIDIGTGAGFPGIPLKIVYPNISITLLDSLNKRITFLNEVIEQLELEDVNCIHGRAEDFGSNNDYREKYDICVSRAVANLSTLSEYCVPFIKVGGIFVSYKSSGAAEEVVNAKNAMKKLNCRIREVKELELIQSNEVYQRNFVIIEKKKNLDKRYPRKAGMPARNPL